MYNTRYKNSFGDYEIVDECSPKMKEFYDELVDVMGRHGVTIEETEENCGAPYPETLLFMFPDRKAIEIQNI